MQPIDTDQLNATLQSWFVKGSSDGLPTLVTGNSQQGDNGGEAVLRGITDKQANMVSIQENILSMQQSMGLDMSALRASALQIQSNVDMMRDIQEQGLNQLTKIEQNTRPISGMADDLSDIKRMVRDNS